MWNTLSGREIQVGDELDYRGTRLQVDRVDHDQQLVSGVAGVARIWITGEAIEDGAVAWREGVADALG